MSEGLRIAGLGGVVLLLFGLLSYAMTGRFDLWCAVHVAGGGVLVAAAAILNLARVRRGFASRGNRERFLALGGTLLFAAALVAANVIAARRPAQYDATENKIHTLAPKTEALLGHLADPVEIVAFLSPGDPARDDVERTLDRFRAGSGGKLSWRFVDPEADPGLADRLGAKREGVVAVVSGASVARTAGGGAPEEAELAKLVLQVTRHGPRGVRVVAGHGEPRIDDLDTGRGLGLLAGVLGEEGYEVHPWLLPAEGKVPDGTAFVVLAGPEKSLDSREVELLRSYVASGGRLLVLLDPGEDAGVDPILADWRIRTGDDVVIDQVMTPFQGPALGVAPLVSDFPDHPITRGFRENVVLSLARSVTTRDSGGLKEVETKVIARTGPSSWAETRWREALRDGTVGRDADDTEGPVPVAVAAERSGGAGGRIVWIGDVDLATNARLGSYFNREFLVNVCRWLGGAEDLIVEPSPGLRASRLDLTEADVRNLFRVSVLFFPEGLLVLGLAVWWRRRTL